MVGLAIRPYAPADLESCRALWVDLTQRHRDIYEDPSIGGETPGLYFDRHLARVGADHIWVAEYEGKVLGLVGLIVEDQEAEVEPIVVAPGYRRHGIGRALLNAMVLEAEKLKVRFLNVRPVARNAEAIAFFNKAGFRLLGHMELCMELRPSPPGAWKSGLELFDRSFDY
jgi:N-acetylglutamate synthase-like GNAT family acetyltransferase